MLHVVLVVIIVVIIAVSVAIAALLAGNAVEDDPQDVGFAGLEAFLGFLDFFRSHLAGMDHQDHAVCQVPQQGRIGDGSTGGRSMST